MRCFIGVPIPETVKQSLHKARNAYLNVPGRMSHVPPENLHITLEFLDEVKDVSKIKELLSKVKFKPFIVSLKDLGFFKNGSYIRTIFAPVVKGKSELVQLHDSILKELSISSDKQFKPHVTLTRVKFVKSTNKLMRACHDVKFEHEFKVDSFNLYSSDLSVKGARHEIIKTFK